LREPKIGIDILHSGVEAEGLEWIMSKMLQAAGIAHQKSLFLLDPSLETSVSIHKTWLSLGLPLAGIAVLQQHYMCKLILGSAVTLPQMKAIWGTFPHDSDIVREMGLNFIRHQLDFEYMPPESSRIREWYSQSAECCKFFQSLEGFFPKFGEVAAEPIIPRDQKPTGVMRKLERMGIPEERKERQLRDERVRKRRLERPRPSSVDSVRSVETVIWIPRL
jgi:hypothetical protein